MCCEDYKLQLEYLLDEALSSDAHEKLSDHLKTCPACTAELDYLRELTSRIPDSSEVRVPPGLWDAIERRLDSGTDDQAGQDSRTAGQVGQDGGQTAHPVTGYRFLSPTRWAWAASLVFVAGLGLFSLNFIDSPAKASTINFAVLLDALPLDAQKAFDKFLDLYDARPGSSFEAKEFAASLDFETPPTLPGGFQLESIYLLTFGDRPGVAASYKRGDEFLAAIFHTPVGVEDFGTHKDYPCAIGKHHGHKVEVGAWKMVHLTDPATCHCVLSQLDEETELPAVMSAVAPRIQTRPHDHGT